jgi:hypothetical protein
MKENQSIEGAPVAPGNIIISWEIIAVSVTVRTMRVDFSPFCKLIGLLLLAVVSSSTGADLKPLLAPSDLPPYPAMVADSQLTHTQQGTRQQLGGLDRSVANANADPEEQSLVREIDELKAHLADAEQKAYHDDPLLLLSDLYTQRAHDWVMAKHNDELNATIKFRSSLGAVQSNERNQALTKAVDLIDMILFSELAGDAKFYPLFQSFYEAMESLANNNGKPKKTFTRTNGTTS